MVVPLQGTERSRGLLSEAAAAIGARRAAAAAGIAGPLIWNIAVTINGVATERVETIKAEVQAAMRERIKELLAQIKAARSYETRLGYI